jgi:membrane protein implicated in regulation of membrane protease activity
VISLVDIIYISFWAIVFVATLAHEIQSLNLTTIWFCISALVSLILAIFGVHIAIQVGVFIVLSIVLLLVTKPLVKKFKNRPAVRTNVDRIIGKIAKVTQKIEGNNYGEVIIDNNYWRAICRDKSTFEVGEEVVILGIEGIKVVVSKIEEEK